MERITSLAFWTSSARLVSVSVSALSLNEEIGFFHTKEEPISRLEDAFKAKLTGLLPVFTEWRPPTTI
jgi:hypothetical protein